MSDILVIIDSEKLPASLPDGTLRLLSLSENSACLLKWTTHLDALGIGHSVIDFSAIYQLALPKISAEYVQWVEHFSLQKIGKKTVREALQFGPVSLWWATRLAEKSHLKSPHVVRALQLMALEDYLKDHSFSGVILASDDGAFSASLHSLLTEIHLPILGWEAPRFSGPSRIFLLGSFMYGMLKFLYRRVLLSILNRHALPPRALGILSPLTRQDASPQTGYYKSRFLKNLPPLFEDKPLMYILSFSSAPMFGYPQAIQATRQFNELSPKDHYSLLESFVSYTSLAVGTCKLLMRSIFNFSLITPSLFHISGRNLSFFAIFSSELAKDICGLGLANNGAQCLAFQGVAKKFQLNSLFYLFELQGWESLLNGVIHTLSPATQTIGIEHVPLPCHSLKCRWTNAIFSGSFAYPLPTILGVCAKTTRETVRHNGFSSCTLFEVEAHRYLYLSPLSKTIGSSPPPQHRTLLVTTSISKLETLRQLSLLNRSDPALFFSDILLKPHPGLPDIDFKSILQFPFEITTKPLSTLLAESPFVYAPESSTVSLESISLGLPTATISPLFSVYTSPNLSTSSELIQAFSDADQGPQGSPPQQPFISLDNSLVLWRRLIASL